MEVWKISFLSKWVICRFHVNLSGSRKWNFGILGCARKLGSMVRINGLFHLLIHGVYWGYNPLILTIDPKFLVHPSTSFLFKWPIFAMLLSGSFR